MKRFILNSPPDSGGIVRLEGKDFHYLVGVRRLGKGAIFPALLPGGIETELRVLSVEGGALSAKCELPQKNRALDKNRGSILKLPPIYLFQALPKAAKMDLIVRQAAEGGISQIIPFESGFSAAKKNRRSESNGKGAATEKILRWERIIREARQQSGSMVPTSAALPCDLERALEFWAGLKREYAPCAGILLHQESLEAADRDSAVSEKRSSPLAKGTFHDYLCDNPEAVVLAVGPEGGFSLREAGLFLAAGFRPLVMGCTILRTETAALYGVAAIRTILLERLAWESKPAQPRND